MVRAGTRQTRLVRPPYPFDLNLPVRLERSSLTPSDTLVPTWTHLVSGRNGTLTAYPTSTGPVVSTGSPPSSWCLWAPDPDKPQTPAHQTRPRPQESRGVETKGVDGGHRDGSVNGWTPGPHELRAQLPVKGTSVRPLSLCPHGPQRVLGRVCLGTLPRVLRPDPPPLRLETTSAFSHESSRGFTRLDGAQSHSPGSGGFGV